MKVYHYTNRAGAQGILDSGVIKANQGIAGYGVYLTSLGPKTNKTRLLVNNYDDGRRVLANSADKIEFWFEFQSEDLDDLKRVKIADRDIHIVPGRDVPLYKHSVAMHF